MSILNHLGKKILILDGAMGTLLQQRGLLPGQRPEDWNIERPADVRAVHKAYFEAGSDVVLTNTFGSNGVKHCGSPYSLERVVSAAVENAKEAAVCANAGGRPLFAALDVGPTGKLLRPLGDLDFLDAVSAFSSLCKAGARAGADLIFVETMSDLYELKAAVLAAKETGLPVFATVAPDSRGKLLTGGDPACVFALLCGLGVDALGFNCGMGPVELRPFVKELLALCDLPVIVKPNAGLPKVQNGKTVYDIGVPAFADELAAFAKEGAWLLGGCCGTTPEHIRALSEAVHGIAPRPIEKKRQTVVCSYGRAVAIPNPQTGGVPVIIGERLNPTGKPRMKAALHEGDYDVLLLDAAAQQEQGADILDVNVGLPGIDEPAVLKKAVALIQAVTDLPLQLDSANPKALEEAMRVYNGKPLVNSVSGKEASMAAVFPLVKKYGGVVVALALDDSGIPETPQGRLAIARRIVETAKSYGIDKKDIVVDPLTLTVSTGSDSAKTVLLTIDLVHKELGVSTVIGLSNISFGLPEREAINGAFLTAALAAGLDAAIANPGSEAVQKAYFSHLALFGLDPGFARFIAKFGTGAESKAANPASSPEATLKKAVERGLFDASARLAAELLKTQNPLEIIDGELIPALNSVGEGYETGRLFLPQLLMSAEAAKAAFEVLRAAIGESGENSGKKPVVLATVKGDIHDIGKNIVKALLQNYGFFVIDLGKDVPPEAVVAAARESGAKLVGLSALMTTTVPSMEETIALLKAAGLNCRTIVGGAVLNGEYAKTIGADHYAKDAMAAVRFAQEVYSE